ncbi:MAG: hypothetical protein K0R59_598 [Sphingobacterium sp.]|nr:hypothetical protein [Sphingobacterium sp.]
MKKIKLYQTACLIAVWLLWGCGIYSKKYQREQRSQNSYRQYEGQRLLFHQKQMDSLSTYWYFWTDSLLSFRPDSGLRADGGQLYVQQFRNTLAEEKLETRQKKAMEKDSLDSVVTQDRKAFSFDTLLIVVSTALAVIYLVWRFHHKML